MKSIKVDRTLATRRLQSCCIGSWLRSWRFNTGWPGQCRIIGRNTVPGTFINLHFSLGMLILLALAIRIGWRWTHPEPTPVDDLPPWQDWSSRFVHYLLYALLVIVPILDWVNASFRRFDVSLFGLVTFRPGAIGRLGLDR
jgi:Prokaryotic cytochrome b561